jgi:hypothetical protein
MDTTVGWLRAGVRIDSVLVVDETAAAGADPRHVYRVVGGPDDGREFDTLTSVSAYAAGLPD